MEDQLPPRSDSSLRRLPFARDYFLRGLVLGNHIRRQDTPPVGVRVNHRAAANNAAWVKHGIAAHFGFIAQQSPKFAQSSIEPFAVHFDHDVPGHKFEI